VDDFPKKPDQLSEQMNILREILPLITPAWERPSAALLPIDDVFTPVQPGASCAVR